MRIKYHGFRVGSKYEQAQINDPKEYLETSLRAEKYIAQYAHQTADGLYWKKEGATWSQIGEQEVDQSFYSGTTGILYYYLKLWETTKNEEFLTIVKEGTRYLASHWKDFFDQSPIFGMKIMDAGLYMGVGGIGMVLLDIYRSTKDDAAKKGALEVAAYYMNTRKQDAQGTYWIDSPAMAMDGGIILFLLAVYQEWKEEQIKEVLLTAASRYVKQGVKTADGGLDFRGWPGPGTRPNYEFGSAGAGYLLTLLYEFTGEEVYLDAAKACAVFLKGIAVPQERGYLIPYDTEEEKPFYFLSSCHGCGGDSKLFYKLYQITGEDCYKKEMDAMIDGLESIGAPEKQSVGFWNTQCFCCGHAGLVQYFVGLYESFGEKHYLNLARRTAAVLMGEREDLENGTTCWPMAFWRVKPAFLTEDLGYYDGISGIASVLLQIYQAESGLFYWRRLPDDPFACESKL